MHSKSRRKSKRNIRRSWVKMKWRGSSQTPECSWIIARPRPAGSAGAADRWGSLVQPQTLPVHIDVLDKVRAVSKLVDGADPNGNVAHRAGSDGAEEGIGKPVRADDLVRAVEEMPR